MNNKTYQHEWYLKNKEKILAKRQDNKEHISKYNKLWKVQNKKWVSEYNKADYKERCKDPSFMEKASRRGSENYRKKYKEQNRFKMAVSCSKWHAKNGNYFPCRATEETIKSKFTGKCFVCGVPEIECKRRLSLDHCHMTGRFRGWLCSNCNLMAGLAKDSPEILQKLKEYLVKDNSSDIVDHELHLKEIF